MTDIFSALSEGLESPPSNAFNVTADDAADLAFTTRGLNVAQSGNVRLTTLGGDTVTVALSAGIVFPIRANRIWATGTTATGIVALY